MTLYIIVSALLVGCWILINWADIVITATTVTPQASSQQSSPAPAGVTITAGQSVYVDSGGLVQLAKADTAPHAAVKGIALNGGAVNQLITIHTGGGINIGATVVVGQFYV